jgi:hypothetical protein
MSSKDTLVKKTANDVHAVLLVDEVTRDPSDTAEKELITNNEAVIFLTINKISCYSTVKTIKTLKPAAGM